MGLVTLLAVLFQTIHSVGHLAEQLKAKKCVHEYVKGASFTHSHHWEKCTICDFTLVSGTVVNLHFDLLSKPVFYLKHLCYPSAENIPFFSGISFSLRGPPLF